MNEKRGVRCCPCCDVESRVKDSRVTATDSIYRVRECPRCGRRWATVEMFDHDIKSKAVERNAKND